MSDYRWSAAAIRALVRDDAVHRDVYLSPALFDLEMERLWRSAWVYIGHDSQVPNAGDFLSVNIARQPLLLLRGSDGVLRVLLNRCAHKGSRLVGASSGNCGRLLRCSYHGWTYTLDGTLRTVPIKSGYADTRFAESEAAKGLTNIEHVANYRGFVFIRLSRSGASFEEYFGDSLSSIDNLADRSPVGRLEVAGAPLRYLHNSNWKMFVENLNDTMHPMVAHESSAGTARQLWKDQPADAPKPMVIEQFLPFVSNYEFFDKMGSKIYDNGHSYTGVNFSIHSSYSAIPEYAAASRTSARSSRRGGFVPWRELGVPPLARAPSAGRNNHPCHRRDAHRIGPARCHVHCRGHCHLHSRLSKPVNPDRASRLLCHGRRWPLLPRDRNGLDPRTRVPVFAIILQIAWTIVIAISGRYEQILNYVVSMDFLFFGLTATTIFVFRRRAARGEMNTSQGYRMPGHPVSTALFVAICWWVVINTVYRYPQNSLVGFVLLLAGIAIRNAAWHGRTKLTRLF